MGGAQGDPKKMNFRHFFGNNLYFRTKRFFSSNLVSYLDKAWCKLSNDSFRMVVRQMVEVLSRFKVARAQDLEKWQFFGFFEHRISGISESENFGTQGLHLLYLGPLEGGGEL